MMQWINYVEYHERILPVEPLFGLAFRSALVCVANGRISPANFIARLQHNPVGGPEFPVPDIFSPSYVPIVMVPGDGVSFEGVFKRSVEFITPNNELYFNYNNSYQYFDVINGDVRLNIINGPIAFNFRHPLDVATRYFGGSIDAAGRKGEYKSINIIEQVASDENFRWGVGARPYTGAEIAQRLAARERKPVAFHVGETDYVSYQDALCAREAARSDARTDLPSAAGMRRTNPFEPVEFKINGPRDSVAGIEYYPEIRNLFV
ncbi:hypothetical protein [Ochrobactrum sp. BTU1]|uniref:hypothetical protein n=1 Tax=Ochrobactrum sp. BTU1 TaxID=2840456 RepID=UPI001C05BEF5|nr:hypothetical protein KMS41_21685 [Ochrobactrum sp. BTU1]